MTNEQKRWTDERLDTLASRVDALSTDVELLRGMTNDVVARIDKLAAVVELHEKKWRQIERSFAAALRAGLQAWDQNGT